MTVDRALLDISQPDFALGMSYVAASRVRSLSGIICKGLEWDAARAMGKPGVLRTGEEKKTLLTVRLADISIPGHVTMATESKQPDVALGRHNTGVPLPMSKSFTTFAMLLKSRRLCNSTQGLPPPADSSL